MTTRRVLVVGAGTRFLSGISYYTHRLAVSLAGEHRVSVLLMRRMMPAALYPGKERVGTELVRLTYPPGVTVQDGLDWFWGASAVRALALLRRERPEVIVLQWWTGTVLHSYLLVALVGRWLGARVVLEVHEAQDVGEMDIPLAGRYVARVFPVLLRRCAAVVVHSAFDRDLVDQHFGLQDTPVRLIPHGPYTLEGLDERAEDGERGSPDGADRPCRLLSFGVIRPFKGVEDLLEAFAMLTEQEARAFRLTVVGETWEGWTRPAEMIAAHPHRELITFVNRYVDDDEVTGLFAAADAVVLPYHRSSSSGPLQMAMGNGRPVLVTSVGGLVEAAEGYQGAVFVPPHDPVAIRAALPELARRAGTRYSSASSWARTSSGYAALFDQLLPADAGPAR